MPARDLTRWAQNLDGSWRRSSSGNTEVKATESALELAAELGVDLAAVSGSGRGGKITKPDVEAAAGD